MRRIMEDKKHELAALKAELEELQPQLEKTYKYSSEYRALASKADALEKRIARMERNFLQNAGQATLF
jgi:predicted RNase H-like nuclease (RuvC/YqgF family)